MFTSQNPKDNPYSDEYDWRNTAAFEASSPAMTWLRANEAAIATALKAAEFKKCSWKFDYEKIYPNIAAGARDMPAPVSQFAHLLFLNAIVAGHNNSWPEVARSVLVMRAAARHCAAAHSFFVMGTIQRMDSLAVAAIEKSLAAAGARPNAEALCDLERIIQLRLSEGCGWAEIMEGERDIGLAAMDWAASDTADDGKGIRLNLVEYINVPATADLYRVVYPVDRWHFERLMNLRTAEIRDAEAGHCVLQTMPQGSLENYAEAPFWISKRTLGRAEFYKDRAVGLLARWRMALAGIALLRYRLEHNRWPSNLSQTGLEQDLLIDPCDPRGISFGIQAHDDGSVTLRSAAYKDFSVRRLAGECIPIFHPLTFMLYPPEAIAHFDEAHEK